MTTATMHTILDVEFDTDELKDIVMHGMSVGEDNYIHAMTEGHPEIASIDRLKEHMVWSYVELKAYELVGNV